MSNALFCMHVGNFFERNDLSVEVLLPLICMQEYKYLSMTIFLLSVVVCSNVCYFSLCLPLTVMPRFCASIMSPGP